MKSFHFNLEIGKYKIKLNKKKTFVIVILVFILGNALLNTGISMDISYEIRVLIEKIIPYGTFKWFDYFLSKGIRKCAHYTEYFVLSFIISKYYLFKNDSVTRTINVIYIIFTIGLIDETLQSFVGRSSKISDIWLDLFGGICGIIIYTMCRDLKEKVKENKNRSEK